NYGVPMTKRVEPIVPDTFLKPDKAQVHQTFLKEFAESVHALSEDEWNRIVKHSGAPDSLRPMIEALVAMYRALKGGGKSRKTPDARRFLTTFQNATRNMVALLLTVMGNNQIFDAI